MASTRYRLGDLIEEIDRKNEALMYDLSYVRGISNTKEITLTKADVDETVINKFYIIVPGEFIYNPRTTRMGEKVGLAYNSTNTPLLFTFNNVAFRVKQESKRILIPDYLYIYFNRSEFDRYAMVNSWGSATELFTFDEMCNIAVDLPNLSVQQKYVDIYKALVANQQSYERGLEDLKLVCDGYIEALRRKMPCEKIGKHIMQKNTRNTDKRNDYVVGLSTKKEFREAQSRVNREELGNYKIVEPDEFAFVPTTDTWKVLAFALNKFGHAVVVSPIYEVFSVDKTSIVPEYLSMWLSRQEFDRYARFNSWGSARENFSFADMANVEIPIPDIKVQQAIAEIYSVYVERKKINEQLKAQIKDICPILIKGSLEEGKKNA